VLIFVSFKLMNLSIISTSELVAVNSIAVQYVRPTDSVSLISRSLVLSRGSQIRVVYSMAKLSALRIAELLLVILVLSTQFAELTIVIFVTNLSVRRTDHSTELIFCGIKTILFLYILLRNSNYNFTVDVAGGF